jgi:hypothetical protein
LIEDENIHLHKISDTLSIENEICQVTHALPIKEKGASCQKLTP